MQLSAILQMFVAMDIPECFCFFCLVLLYKGHEYEQYHIVN